MNILDLLVGKPLATSDERAEQIGPSRGIPIFGLDALSSAAYGPEAALSLLIPLGLLGLQYILPISTAIITLLIIVYFSYRQTIAAYPMGGGSYTVARFNLGPFAGLLAAAALLTDYILTAAVGISAGVGALVSAVPSLQPRTVSLCLGILVIVTHPEPARTSRSRLCVHAADLSFCRDDCHHHRGRCASYRSHRGASPAAHPHTCSASDDHGGYLLAAPESLRQRLHRDHRRRSREQRRASLPRTRA